MDDHEITPHENGGHFGLGSKGSLHGKRELSWELATFACRPPQPRRYVTTCTTWVSPSVTCRQNHEPLNKRPPPCSQSCAMPTAAFTITVMSKNRIRPVFHEPIRTDAVTQDRTIVSQQADIVGYQESVECERRGPMPGP